MKRLLRIGLSTLIQSFFPILCWFLLGLTIDSSLINVFSITYPMAFVANIIKEIFGTGANIKAAKKDNPNSVLSGMTFGIIIGAIIFSLLAVFAEPYIIYMSMDVDIYLTFVRYSFIEIYISMVFQLIVEKLYYEDKDKIATIHSIIFNLINIVVLTCTSLITKNQVIITAVTLSTIAVYTIALLIWQYRKFHLDFNIWLNIKYESNDIVASVLMLVSYFFGFSNVFANGIEYAAAINFVAIITDTQWDAYDAVSTVAKLDIVKEDFNLKKHLKNGLIFVAMLVSSILILFFSLFSVYGVNMQIGIYFMLFQIADFIICLPMYTISPYIQLKHSALKNTANEIVCYVIRAILSVTLPTVFCMDIGQVSVSVISMIFYFIIIKKYLKVNKNGFIEAKLRPQKKQNDNGLTQ